MNILECSTRGDRRFSSFIATVNIFGVNSNIETHYQSCKRFKNKKDREKPKGKSPDYIVVNNKKMDTKFLTPFFKLLWIKYLDMHPELVRYANKFDDFHDMFKGKNTINCQADVIREYIKNGKQSMMQDELMKEFIKELSKGE